MKRDANNAFLFHSYFWSAVKGSLISWCPGVKVYGTCLELGDCGWGGVVEAV